LQLLTTIFRYRDARQKRPEIKPHLQRVSANKVCYFRVGKTWLGPAVVWTHDPEKCCGPDWAKIDAYVQNEHMNIYLYGNTV